MEDALGFDLIEPIHNGGPNLRHGLSDFPVSLQNLALGDVMPTPTRSAGVYVLENRLQSIKALRPFCFRRDSGFKFIPKLAKLRRLV